jgi:hypothetical protein
MPSWLDIRKAHPQSLRQREFQKTFFLKLNTYKDKNSYKPHLGVAPLGWALTLNAINSAGDREVILEQIKSLFIESVTNAIENITANNIKKERKKLTEKSFGIHEYNKIMKSFGQVIKMLAAEYSDVEGVNFNETVQVNQCTITASFVKYSFLKETPKVRIISSGLEMDLKFIITQNDFLEDPYKTFFQNISIEQFKEAIGQMEERIKKRLIKDKAEATDILKEYFPEDVMEYSLNMGV